MELRPDGDGFFGPGEICTRGQIVTFLHRAYVPEARVSRAGSL